MNYNQRAFTLLELITVVTLLGILTLVVVPNIVTTTDKWTLESTAREMVQDIRWSQQLAITEGINYNFEIHLTEKYYRVRRHSANGPTLKTVHLSDRIESVTSTFASYGYGGSFTDYRILSYSPTGNPSQTGSIVLRTSDGKQIIITVAVGTGRAMIKK